MDVVGDGRNATGSSSGKRESGTGSEPCGSDKESDNDEKVHIYLNILKFGIFILLYIICYFVLYLLYAMLPYKILVKHIKNCLIR